MDEQADRAEIQRHQHLGPARVRSDQARAGIAATSAGVRISSRSCAPATTHKGLVVCDQKVAGTAVRQGIAAEGRQGHQAVREVVGTELEGSEQPVGTREMDGTVAGARW